MGGGPPPSSLCGSLPGRELMGIAFHASDCLAPRAFEQVVDGCQGGWASQAQHALAVELRPEFGLQLLPGRGDLIRTIIRSEFGTDVQGDLEAQPTFLGVRRNRKPGNGRSRLEGRDGPGGVSNRNSAAASRSGRWPAITSQAINCFATARTKALGTTSPGAATGGVGGVNGLSGAERAGSRRSPERRRKWQKRGSLLVHPVYPFTVPRDNPPRTRVRRTT